MAEDGEVGNRGVELEKELSCSICTDVLYQPLTLLDCLHTYCGSCLKEWFKWQATAAPSNRRITIPYTCPSCRAQVRDTRPNATVTTLLDMFLKANPGRGKSEEEMAEMRQHYKPGDNVIPPVNVQQSPEDSEDERLLTEVRELSMEGIDPDVAASRRTARAARHERRRAEAATTTSHRTRYTPEELGRNQQRSRWAGRQNERINGQERHIEHQSSLRSLLSASDAESTDVQEDIMHSILASGMLDGIDLDHLTPEQEEELTERIVDAYRRRQRHRDPSRNRARREPDEGTSHVRQSSGDDRARHHRRTDSGATGQSRPRPPISRPHLFEQTLQTPSPQQRRSTSSTSQQSTRSDTRGGAQVSTSSATRSATDLSDRPGSSGNEREHRRRLSSSGRSITEPNRVASLGQGPRDRVTTTNTRSDADRVSSSGLLNDTVRQEATNISSTTLGPPYPIDQPESQHRVRPVFSTAAFAPELVNAHPTEVVSSDLSIKCSRCEKPDLQYDLHYHCAKCSSGSFNICLQCYRCGRGCDHWFGFGYMAYHRWQQSAPSEGLQSHTERPHVLTPRRYVRLRDQGNQSLDLQEGAFCERCFAYSDETYWHCNVCLEGAWGFCNTCTNKGKHCTHPLQAVAHISTLRHVHSDPTKTIFAQLPHLKEDSYVTVPIQRDCDICRRSISTSTLGWHCYECGGGDYDLCSNCYRNLASTGKISAANGPNGWRRCLQGHRMAGIGFSEYSETGQLRAVLREPVGGWALKDEDRSVGASSQSTQQVLPPDGGVGLNCLALWSWFPAEGVTDELTFPKNAEIREAERINNDWYWGVYAGAKGLFPGNHVRVL